jgi:hypothetical protein
MLLGLARAVTLGSKSYRTHGYILLSLIRLPNLEAQVPVFISPRNKVAQLYPRALGSLFVTSYDSQGVADLKLKLIYDRHSVGQSVLMSGAHLGPVTNFSFFLKFPSDSCSFVIL